MISAKVLKQIAPNAKAAIINDLEKYFDMYLADYGVDSYLRVCHFIAQAAHESDSFNTLEEYASGAAYEGRQDLGNTQKGDGKRYKGRGIFQITGRANYRDIGLAIDEDLENEPELAADPEISVLTALEFWDRRNLNKYADADDVLGISKRINGVNRKTGLPNGFEERKRYLAKAKKVLAPFFQNEASPIVLARLGEKSDYVAQLQNMMITKGANIHADGDFGPATEAAVKELQAQFGLEPTGEIDTEFLDALKA